MLDPSRLRVAGFAVTAAGALVGGIGSTLVWPTAGRRQDVGGVLDLEFRGLDLIEGILTLLVAAATLAVLLSMRRLHGNGRVRAAIALLDPDLAVRADASGVWPSITGGALVVVGAAINLAWARRSEGMFAAGP